MLPAGSYPLQALLLVVRHFELLQLVLSEQSYVESSQLAEAPGRKLTLTVAAEFFAIEAVVPVYWIFSSLVLKHQQSIFSRTLQIRGVDPAQVSLSKI